MAFVGNVESNLINEGTGILVVFNIEHTQKLVFTLVKVKATADDNDYYRVDTKQN
jgi:hypothetical protein